jgi:transcriptional regulator with PAS, ATPase and Fis domain
MVIDDQRQVRETLECLSSQVQQLGTSVVANQAQEDMLGDSQAMRDVIHLIDRVAAGDATVLVQGESGTGKEVAARRLHGRSERAARPFVAVNCAALPETLLESELFGHVKGAFTDASRNRPGLFAQASGGTLFLDEIGELPLSMQAKLLRAIEDRKVRPIGSDREIEVNTRIIAATNRDLREVCEEGRFREDLYFRLAVMEVNLPPLRARGDDVLLIAQHELLRRSARVGKLMSGFAPEATVLLLAHDWPGNVRELQNCIERAVAVARFGMVAAEDLPERIRCPKRTPVAAAALDSEDELLSLHVVEKRHILRVLHAVGGHRKQAAQILGIDRKTLYRKLEQWGRLDDSQE